MKLVEQELLPLLTGSVAVGSGKIVIGSVAPREEESVIGEITATLTKQRKKRHLQAGLLTS